MTRAGHHTMLGGASAMRCSVFDGNLTSIMSADMGTISPTSQPDLSVAFWANAQIIDGRGRKCVSMFDSRSNKSTGPQYSIGDDPDGMRFYVIFQYVKGFDRIPTGAALNSWHHYLATFTPGTLKMYYDGALISTQTGANSWLRDNASAILRLDVGGNSYDSNGAIHGRLANVNIFDFVVSASDAAFLASKPNAVLTTALHQYLFANDDGTDTGSAATKLHLNVGSTTAFEKLSTGGGRLWLLLCRSSCARRSSERRAA